VKLDHRDYRDHRESRGNRVRQDLRERLAHRAPKDH